MGEQGPEPLPRSGQSEAWAAATFKARWLPWPFQLLGLLSMVAEDPSHRCHRAGSRCRSDFSEREGGPVAWRLRVGRREPSLPWEPGLGLLQRLMDGRSWPGRSLGMGVGKGLGLGDGVESYHQRL